MPLLKPAAATALASRGRRPGISAEEQASQRRRGGVESRMFEMFEEREKDPFGYVMTRPEQTYYKERRADVYGAGRQQAGQRLAGAMARTGAMDGGGRKKTWAKFGQTALNDRSMFEFMADKQRLQQEQSSVQSLYGMGKAISGSPMLGTQQTDLANERTRQRNMWRNRWSGMLSQMGGGYI